MKRIRTAIRKYYRTKFYPKKIIPGKDLIPSTGKVFDENELIQACQAVLDGWWTEGRFAKILEKKLAQFINVKDCILVNSGSSADLLAIAALKSKKLGNKCLKNGDEVITTGVNFPTTVNPILINNLVPVFVDVELGSYNVNIEELKRAISKKTKAVFLAHTLGNPFKIKEILKFCRQHNLWLIEDNCDALGSKYDNKFTGSFGDISTLSFYPAHQITTGEGGAVLTNDLLLARIIRSLRDWGKDCWCHTGQNNACRKRFNWQLGGLPKGYDHKYIYSELGYNLKLTDIQAAIGLAQFRKIKKFIKTRQENFSYLYQKLIDLSDYFILPTWEKNSKPAWFGFPLTIKKESKIDRTKLLKFMLDKKIDSRLFFGSNIIRQPYFKNYNFSFRQVGNLVNCDKVTINSFWLGIYPGLKNFHLDYMSNVIKKFLL